MKATLALVLLLASTALSQAVEWPDSDQQLDSLLRKLSPKYLSMAQSVQERGGYRIKESDTVPLGMVAYDEEGLVILLNSKLKDERRATILIWELANAFQRPQFNEIDRRANEGRITTAKEFGLRMELIEYDSFRHHKEVLDQITRDNKVNEKDLLFFINDKLTRFAQYSIPYAHDYIEAQAKGGHTSHYEEWFYRQSRAPESAKTKGEQGAVGQPATPPRVGD